MKLRKKLGLKISKIFENKGEKYFRQIEEIKHFKIFKKKKTVISLRWRCFFKQ